MIKLAIACVISLQAVGAAELRVDPTRPLTLLDTPSQGSEQNAQLALQAVFINKTSRYAVINNVNYQVGDEVKGMRVEEITQNGVILRQGREVTELLISTANVKKDNNHVF